MKTLTINVQKTINTGNYNSVRVGGEFSLDEGETLEQATILAAQAVDHMFNIIQNPSEASKVAQQEAPAVPAEAKPAPSPAPNPEPEKPKRVHVRFNEEHNILQKLLDRIALNDTPIKSEKDKAKYPGKDKYPRVDRTFLDERYTFDKGANEAINLALTLNN